MKQPTEQDIIKAYNIAKETGSDSTCKVLEALYPDVEFTVIDNRPVEERIKTFDDACEAIGKAHPLVDNYNQWADNLEDNDSNLRAFLKLRIITAALNEGWKPEFSECELRWYPLFTIISADELSEKSEEWKAARTIVPLDNYRVVGRSGSGEYASGGLAFESAVCELLGSCCGSRLVFKSKALANYAANQFPELWADYYLIRKAGKEDDNE